VQDLSGRKLGQYELRERLGRGGMAEVYKSYQPGMDRFVAVKVMLAGLNEDESFVERFRREARAVGNLRHPYIVQAFDFGVEAGVYYLAMEYITGGNLKAHIEKQGKLSVQDSVRIATQLADALAYAHEKGMVHRDMKPANVMFLDDSLKHAILTDFGIARIMGEAGLTGTGMAVGTPDYMSPEAGRGETTDHRSDIYALGIILYEMLVGEVPYSADTPLAVIMKHINAPLPTRHDHDGLIPEFIETIILRCLAKNVEDRFQSAQELKVALDKASAQLDSSISTAANALPPKPATAVSSSRKTVPTMFGAEDAPTEAVPMGQPMSAKPPTPSNSLMLGLGTVAIVAVVALIAFFAMNGSDDNPEPTAAPEVAVDVTEDVPTLAPTDMPTDETGAESTSAPTSAGEASANGITIPYDAVMPPLAENLDLASGIAPIVDEIEILLITEGQEAALAAANTALEEDTDDIETLFARSLAYSCCWDEDNLALADANRIIELVPENSLGYIAQGHAYLNNGDFDAARAAIEQAYELDPDSSHVMWRYTGFSDYDVQLERFDEAEAQGATGWQFITLAANLLFDNGEYERAIPYLYVFSTEELNGAFGYWDARWKLMASLIVTEQAAAAYEFANQFMANYESAEDYARIAYVAYRAGEFEQARDWANTALALDGDTHDARYILALIAWYEDENLDAAMEQLGALENVDIYSFFVSFDFQHDVHLDRARIAYDAGDSEAALTYYDAAIEEQSYVDWLYEERADLHLELGNTEAARSDLEQARQITDDEEYRRALLQRIVDLGAAPTSTPEGTPED
jgi:serine/threonine protein kinase/tetratricopeptide (TPR) repeat protein